MLKCSSYFSTFRKINIWRMFEYFGIGTILIQNLRIHEICRNLSHSSLRKPNSLVKKNEQEILEEIGRQMRVVRQGTLVLHY